MMLKMGLVAGAALIVLAVAGHLWATNSSTQRSGIFIGGPTPTASSTPPPVHAPVEGVVRSWDTEEGFGVVDAPEVPGGCWASFANLAGGPDPFKGQRVRFSFEDLGGPIQDGYRYRAVSVVADQ